MKKILLSFLLFPSVVGAQSLNLPVARPFLIAQGLPPDATQVIQQQLNGTPAAVAPGTDTSLVDGSQLKTLWKINSNYTLAFDKTAAVVFCGGREFNDGQWLAGTCRDLLLVTSVESDGQTHKLFHVGMGILTNAEHLNASYIVKGGLDLPVAVEHALGWVGVQYPHLAKLGAPPWLAKLGGLTSIDGFYGNRPVHTSDVKGTVVYGAAFNLTVPFSLGRN